MRRFGLIVAGSTIDALRTSAQTAFKFLMERLQPVVEGVVVEAFTASVTGDPFRVEHNLGVVPTWAQMLPYESFSTGTNHMDLWATENDRKLWNEKTIVLRAAATSVKVTLLVAYI